MAHLREGSLSAAVLLAATLSTTLGTATPVLAQTGAGNAVGTAAIHVAQAPGTVLELQRELNQLGYNAGPADGLMGARTREAIRAYQRDHNLLVDGQASAALLDHVRASAQSRAAPAPSALPPGFVPVSQLVADIQEALRTLGYDIAAPSGRLTDETRAAIRSYENGHGLLVSGEPSPELLEHMRRRIAGAAVPPAVDADTIAGIQAELRRRGYAIPLVSGTLDGPTRQAIREYQQGTGVSATGEPSVALLDELRAAGAEAPSDAGLSREQRAAAQRALNARGYDAGPPDGALGPRSRVAIRTFQADQNLAPTGELTPRTLELLDIAAAAPVTPPEEASQWRMRLRDDFADGDHTRNPAWRVAAGRFEVRGGGLSSAMQPPSARTDDIGRQLLGGLLQQQLGITLPGMENAAVAYLPGRVGPVFRVSVTVSAPESPHNHLDVGLFGGEVLNRGYRLVYRASQSRPLQLVLADEQGRSVVASAAFRLDNGTAHRLVWERAADGRMQVSRNGEMLIDIVEPAVPGNFEGFSLVNAGGEWVLHEVAVEDRD